MNRISFLKFLVLMIQLLYVLGFIITLKQKLYQDESEAGMINIYIIYVSHLIFNIQLFLYLANRERSDVFYIIWIIPFSTMILDAFSISIALICNPKYRGDS